MPGLEWKTFNSLPGSKNQNFEDLCRALVWHHYGRYGKFSALKNQPGVEFHLKIDEACSLGNLSRRFGWQCKIHDRNASGDLSAAGKRDIEESLKKTKKHLPSLTDWVLWTPYTLSKKDQKWFSALNTPYKLHQWTEKEVDALLSGPGAMLRSTYFGELVLTPEELEKRHREAVQPIRDRWLEPVHQTVDGERVIRRMLGEPGSWAEMVTIGGRLRNSAAIISRGASGCPPEVAKLATRFTTTCSDFADTLLAFHQVLAEDLESFGTRLRERNTLIDLDIGAVPRKLRALNLPIALDATNALDDMRTAQELLAEAEDFLGVGLVAFLADAGGGKTQLAAQLTAPVSGRPAGVFLHGRDLHRGQSLDDLAKRFVLHGNPLASMEKLLAALDGAAKRAKCRLPVLIDGLNEAENPKDWKGPLASLKETVRSYPNVLVVCTLRTGERRREDQVVPVQTTSAARESFAVMALPEDVRRIDSEGFGGDVDSAIKKYFDHFKIDSGDAEIPVEFFQHPLTLRIFCQVTNPGREKVVKIGYFPSSLSSLFEKYIASSCNRITSMTSLSHSYTSDDVTEALYRLGIESWDARKREVSERTFREKVGDSGRQWNSSIVNLLAQEGIIFRNPGDLPGHYELTFVYDALGGFVVAHALLSKHSKDADFNWLKQEEAIEALGGDKSHALAGDIFRSLVALTPRRMNGKQLWNVAPESFRGSALRYCLELDTEFLDKDTVAALLRLFDANPKKRGILFHRLRATRGVPDHPLNADFLDAMLAKMTVAERDLSWTEWIREGRAERLDDLIGIEKRWRENLTERTPADTLRSKWVMWLLTSSDHELRDIATRALYWFGRTATEVLYSETIRSLEMNDPYVPERMLAAGYGVAMARHYEDGDFAKTELRRYARSLFDSMFSKGATHGTTHVLMRDYASRTVELAVRYNSDLFTKEEQARTTPPFADEGIRKWEESKTAKEEFSGRDSPFRMDFENYTLGRLVTDRRNYDYKHEGYQTVRAQVLWRVEQLGWSPKLFKQIDEAIERGGPLQRTGAEEKKTDRYGKKYSLIAFLERLGLAHDRGELEEWRELRWSADIDPSFPQRVTKATVMSDDFLGDASSSRSKWIAKGPRPNIKPYLQLTEVSGERGPWIALDGSIGQEDEDRGRRLFAFVRAFLVSSKDADAFLRRLNRQDLGGRWLPEKPDVMGTFAGEIPWCSTFPENGSTEFSFVTSEKTVKVKRTRKEFFLDGKRVDDEVLSAVANRLLEIRENGEGAAGPSPIDDEIKRITTKNVATWEKEIRRTSTKFHSQIPVCDFSSEIKTAASSVGHATILAKEITTELKLIGKPQTFDLFTATGEKATLNVSDRSEDFNNYQSMFYVKESLLRAFLKKKKLVLLWAIWGERGCSISQTGKLRKSEMAGDGYSIFGFTERYTRALSKVRPGSSTSRATTKRRNSRGRK